jgi:hypothetical protein
VLLPVQAKIDGRRDYLPGRVAGAGVLRHLAVAAAKKPAILPAVVFEGLSGVPAGGQVKYKAFNANLFILNRIDVRVR